MLGFLIWSGIVIFSIVVLVFLYKLVGSLFMEKFMKYEITWHDVNGFCKSDQCQPKVLTYRSSLGSQYNSYSNAYSDRDITDKEERIRKCCIASAKDSCGSWVLSLWKQYKDSKALDLFSSIDGDRKELLALKKRDEKILEELRRNPGGDIDLPTWQKIFEVTSKDLS